MRGETSITDMRPVTCQDCRWKRTVGHCEPITPRNLPEGNDKLTSSCQRGPMPSRSSCRYLSPRRKGAVSQVPIVAGSYPMTPPIEQVVYRRLCPQETRGLDNAFESPHTPLSLPRAIAPPGCWHSAPSRELNQGPMPDGQPDNCPV